MKSRIRNLWNDVHDTTMLFSLILWLCVLPLVLLVTIPFFGWQGGLVGAVITFVVALVACYAICWFPNISTTKDSYVGRPRLR
jgi:glucose-6-phosphate-specific signal transduction histidine kinase